MIAAVALISAAAGALLWRSMQPGAAPEALLVLPQPRVIADFDLIDHRGQAFSLNDLRGSWSLLFFGFTYCPDVCPDTLFKLEKAYEAVKQGWAGAPPLRIYFVSVDPERDTEYVEYIDPDFIGLTGDHRQLLPLTLQLGIVYYIEDHEPGTEHYGVDHSTGILLIDPQGRLHGAFPAPHDPGKIAADISMTMKDNQ
jgi:protein SCO1/2